MTISHWGIFPGVLFGGGRWRELSFDFWAITNLR